MVPGPDPHDATMTPTKPTSTIRRRRGCRTTDADATRGVPRSRVRGPVFGGLAMLLFVAPGCASGPVALHRAHGGATSPTTSAPPTTTSLVPTTTVPPTTTTTAR